MLSVLGSYNRSLRRARAVPASERFPPFLSHTAITGLAKEVWAVRSARGKTQRPAVRAAIGKISSSDWRWWVSARRSREIEGMLRSTDRPGQPAEDSQGAHDGAPWLRQDRTQAPLPPTPPPRRHDKSDAEGDLETLTQMLRNVQRQLADSEEALRTKAQDVRRLEAHLKRQQMERETALSDLDATRERAALLEHELRAARSSTHKPQSADQDDQLRAAEARARELQGQNHTLDTRIRRLEHDLLAAEHLHAVSLEQKGPLEREENNALMSALNEHAAGDGTWTSPAMQRVHAENIRLLELARHAEERRRSAEEAVRELEKKLSKSSEVAKLRQIHLNELQAKIQSERQVWEQLQKVERQQQVRSRQALVNKLNAAQAREAEMQESLSSFMQDFRSHLGVSSSSWLQRSSTKLPPTTFTPTPIPVASQPLDSTQLSWAVLDAKGGGVGSAPPIGQQIDGGRMDAQHEGLSQADWLPSGQGERREVHTSNSAGRSRRARRSMAIDSDSSDSDSDGGQPLAPLAASPRARGKTELVNLHEHKQREHAGTDIPAELQDRLLQHLSKLENFVQQHDTRATPPPAAIGSALRSASPATSSTVSSLSLPAEGIAGHLAGPSPPLQSPDLSMRPWRETSTMLRQEAFL